MIRRMDTNLRISVSSLGDGADVITLEGPVVISNMFPVQTAVRESKAATLYVDMTGVPYVDSAAIGVLVGAYVSRDKDGRKLVLAGVCQRVRHTLQVTQVEPFFTFVDKTPERAAGV